MHTVPNLITLRCHIKRKVMTSRVRPAATPHHAATLNPALEVGKAAQNSTTLNRSHNRAFPGERSAENKRKLICVKDAQIKVRHSLQVMYIMELSTRDAFWGGCFSTRLYSRAPSYQNSRATATAGLLGTTYLIVLPPSCINTQPFCTHKAKSSIVRCSN